MAAGFAKDFFVEKLSASRANFDRKVTIVGAGSVGTACANAILNRRDATEICLIDTHSNTLAGEVMDIQHGSCFLDNPKVTGGKDYILSQGSHIVVIAASVRGKSGETRQDLMQRNINVIYDVIPKVMEHNKNPILLLVTNPCELITFLAWKLSGLPKNRVLGIGTTLDTARFRYFLSERLGVAPTECTGWIIGENGDLSVPIWTSVNVGGIRLRDVYPKMGRKDDKDNWNGLHKKVMDVTYQITESKGHTNWATSVAVATIIHDIFNNTGCIRPVATSAVGQYGIEKNIFLSLPCVVTSDGVTSVVKLPLDDEEIANIQEVARIAYKKMCQFKL